MPIVTVSAAALIDTDGRILLAQRPEGKHMAGMWEFPGGKVEAGESPDDAVRREMMEELGVDLCEHCIQPFTFITHEYDAFTLVLLLYIARRWEGIPEGKEGQALKWVYASEMKHLPMPPADVPLVAMLRDYLPAQK